MTVGLPVSWNTWRSGYLGLSTSPEFCKRSYGSPWCMMACHVSLHVIADDRNPHQRPTAAVTLPKSAFLTRTTCFLSESSLEFGFAFNLKPKIKLFPKLWFKNVKNTKVSKTSSVLLCLQKQSLKKKKSKQTKDLLPLSVSSSKWKTKPWKILAQPQFCGGERLFFSISKSKQN